MSNDTKTPLYLGSTNFTQLSTMLRLMMSECMAVTRGRGELFLQDFCK